MVRTGVIGYNDGNGHPYSFSAIINGYDKERMEETSYPVIADYLNRRSPQEFGIGDMKVTHVWTPYPEISSSIAEACKIEKIVVNYEEMLDEVDAILILRDDAPSHLNIAEFFLEVGKKVFIDKPLTICSEELDYFTKYLENGQLMSCSGLRYHPDIESKFQGELDPQEIIFTSSLSVLDWWKYGIHVLEALTPLVGYDIVSIDRMNQPGVNLVKIEYATGKYSIIHINEENSWGIYSDIYMDKGKSCRINFNDNFTCFKRTLEEFYKQIVTGIPAIPPQETIQLINTLIAAKSPK